VEKGRGDLGRTTRKSPPARHKGVAGGGGIGGRGAGWAQPGGAPQLQLHRRAATRG